MKAHRSSTIVREEFPGHITGAERRGQSVTADWTVLRDLIEGVALREVRNVPKSDGLVTEIYRRDWELDDRDVEQVFQVTLVPGAISAWHVHRDTTDRLFVNAGMARIVLYDARRDSQTGGQVNEFLLGTARPGLVLIPPGVWHGVQALGREPVSLLNVVDVAYRYGEPDHWELPWDTDRIPYRFRAGGHYRQGD